MKKPTMYKGHLGGHNWITHTDEGAIKYLKKHFNIKTMLDIGCGPGGQIITAINNGIDAEGVDGDPRVLEEAPNINITTHDFTNGPFRTTKEYDLGWSTEFVEHVREKFVPNFMNTFQQCKAVAITHAPPGTPGNHHVNCKDAQYWIDVFGQYGFEYDEKHTNGLREASTMKRDFVRHNGLVFTRREK